MADSLSQFKGYEEFLQSLKTQIQSARLRASVSINRELVLLYWQIGRDILQRQEEQGWGAKVIDRLSKDLQRSFPDMKGFSPRNLKYMRSFADAYPEVSFVQQLAAQIPWFHNCTLLDKLKDRSEREWYIHQAIECGWSRNVLVHHIDSQLYHRQGGAVTNFSQTLPSPQSDLAQQMMKDPYHLEFLQLHKNAQERDMERALVSHIRDFLLELGVGFAFVGNQYRLNVGGEEFFIDLLFYHLKLRCYIVIDLKMGEFKPEFSGQMNFYISAVDDMLRHSDDQPTIGIILCRSQNKTIAEYALRGIQKPIGVATHYLGRRLPSQLEENLPSIEQLESEIQAAANNLTGNSDLGM
jgi:predicted nuclease of restriction endonuclease-like (RecB) superfamily